MALGSLAASLPEIAGGAAGAALLLAVGLWASRARNAWAVRSALASKGLQPPHTMFASYGERYLSRIVAVSGADTLSNEQRNDRVLALTGDLRVSLALAAALVLANLAVAPSAPLAPYGFYVALFCAAMGAAYGIVAVLEKRLLGRLLAGGPYVNPGWARRASRFTKLRFATLWFAFPALIGGLAKYGHDQHYDIFYDVLRFAPLAPLAVALVWPTLGRVLWACRVSVVSALVGYYLFLGVIQADDLFADTTYGAQPWLHVAFWTFVFAALAFIWALPVHFAARSALDRDPQAIGPDDVLSAALVRWTPRVLGMIPVASVLLGVFGAAIETRYAQALDYGLRPQFALLALGGWFTLGFVIVMMIERRNLVDRLLDGPHSGRSQTVVWVCALATSIVFAVLVLFPLHATQWLDRAALVPILLGSGVLLFGFLGRRSDEWRVPVLGFAIAACVLLTAANDKFDNVRPLPKAGAPHQASLPDAVQRWRAANHCDGDPKACPPALIVAADGGASRAGFFSAVVLGEILDQLSDASKPSKCADPQDPARCIFAFSGVSGGSLGLATVKAALLDADPGPPCKAIAASDPNRWRRCLGMLVAGDYLSPVFVGLAFRDELAPPIYPFNDPDVWGDRAALLEKAWERNYLAQKTGDSHASDCGSTTDAGLCRPFASSRTDGGWTPLLLLNGTSVQTGRRVIASELEPTWQTNHSEIVAMHPWAYDFFDIFQARCSDPGLNVKVDNCVPLRGNVNVRMSTAALLSARFPIISPAGHARMAGANPHGDEIVDGGYFENSGLTTALDVAAGLWALNLTPIVLSISNDPTVEKVQAVVAPNAAGAASSQNPVGLECSPGPPDLDVRSADANSFWSRAAELLEAPLNALLNTRDGHGDEASLALKERLQEWDAHVPNRCDPKNASFFPVRVYAEGSNFAMPDISMSWWLSPVVRNALDHQVDYPTNKSQIEALLKRLAKAGGDPH